MDDSEVEDPMSPSPSPVKKLVKRRKQCARPTSTSSSGSAGSASRVGSGSSGAAPWNKPLRADTSRDKRKGKRPSPSAATNVGGPSLSGKSVHDGRARIWDRSRHCSFTTLHVNLSHSLRNDRIAYRVSRIVPPQNKKYNRWLNERCNMSTSRRGFAPNPSCSGTVLTWRFIPVGPANATRPCVCPAYRKHGMKSARCWFNTLSIPILGRLDSSRESN